MCRGSIGDHLKSCFEERIRRKGYRKDYFKKYEFTYDEYNNIFIEKKQVKYLDNPLPLPKKHVKRTLDFELDKKDDFDIEIKEDDDFDI